VLSEQWRLNVKAMPEYFAVTSLPHGISTDVDYRYEWAPSVDVQHASTA